MKCQMKVKHLHWRGQAHHPVVKEADQVCKISGASKLYKNGPQGFSIYGVKSLCKVDKKSIEILMLLDAFFLNLPDCKDHVNGASAMSESSLSL